jgi:hypothetical protein
MLLGGSFLDAPESIQCPFPRISTPLLASPGDFPPARRPPRRRWPPETILPIDDDLYGDGDYDRLPPSPPQLRGQRTRKHRPIADTAMLPLVVVVMLDLPRTVIAGPLPTSTRSRRSSNCTMTKTPIPTPTIQFQIWNHYCLFSLYFSRSFAFTFTHVFVC